MQASFIVLAIVIMVGAGLLREQITSAFEGTWIHRFCSLISGR